jgi:hypothetical protein
VSVTRHVRPRRVEPELMDYHKANARRLRSDACAEARRRLRTWVRNLIHGSRISNR